MHKLIPWSIHLYTASGAVLAFLMVISALDANYTLFLWLTLIALVIDSTDGSLARKFHVKEHLPFIDGSLLDNIVDYTTYTFAPVLYFWTSHSVPHNMLGLVIIAMVLISSCYQFSRVDAKQNHQNNYYFLGFPDYWNIIAIYSLLLPIPSTILTAILAICAIFAFIPIKFIYPTRTVLFKKANMITSTVYSLVLLYIIIRYPNHSPLLIYISLLYWLYYIIVSLILNYKLRTETSGV